jgi:hypothetical protein
MRAELNMFGKLLSGLWHLISNNVISENNGLNVMNGMRYDCIV